MKIVFFNNDPLSHREGDPFGSFDGGVFVDEDQ